MKIPSFKKQVDNFRKIVKNKTDQWWSTDRNNMKKVMYKISALFQFDLNA